MTAPGHMLVVTDLTLTQFVRLQSPVLYIIFLYLVLQLRA